MNQESKHGIAEARDTSPVLLVPYVWIGDFVRCHSVVRVLKQRWPNRPVDILTSSLCAPLVDYMPGVRQPIVFDLPRSRIAFAAQRALATRLRERGYAASLVMPRTWKSALAPWLAGIPERTGFIGEFRFGLLNDWRRGEKGRLILASGGSHSAGTHPFVPLSKRPTVSPQGSSKLDD